MNKASVTDKKDKLEDKVEQVCIDKYGSADIEQRIYQLELLKTVILGEIVCSLKDLNSTLDEFRKNNNDDFS